MKALLISGFAVLGLVVTPAVVRAQAGFSAGESAADDLNEIDEEDSPLSPVSPEAASAHRNERELALTDEELRSGLLNGVSLALGEALPWQTLSLEVHYFHTQQLAYSLFAGGGSFDEYGYKRADHVVDIHTTARSVGISVRRYLQQMAQISFQTSLAYTTWSGNAEPHGSDTGKDDATGSQVLGTGFSHAGLTLGMSAALSKTWKNGVFFEWTPFGIRGSRLLSQSFSRSEADLSVPIRKNIQRIEIYGFINAKLGYLF